MAAEQKIQHYITLRASIVFAKKFKLSSCIGPAPFQQISVILARTKFGQIRQALHELRSTKFSKKT